MTDLLNKAEPFDYESEIAVLTGLIWQFSDGHDTEALQTLSELTEQSFYGEDTKNIYRVLVHYVNEGIEINHLNVLHYFQERKDVGGIATVMKTFELLHYQYNLKYFLDKMKLRALQRDLITKGHRMMELGMTGKDKDLTISDVKEEALLIMDDLFFSSDNLVSRSITKESKDLFAEMASLIPEAPIQLSGLTTGYLDLDYITGGYQKANLIIIAARPAMGKTAFVLNSILKSGKDLKEDEVYIFYSMEQSLTQLALRAASITLGTDITTNDIKNGCLREFQRKAVLEVYKQLEDAPVLWHEAIDTSYHEFERFCRYTYKNRKIKGIFIDHGGQFTLPESGKNQDDTQDMSKIALGLQRFCRELSIPIVMLYQLNRKVEDRTNKRPLMSDLRQSGRWEEAAWIIMFLYRDSYYNNDSEDKSTEVIIAKNKDGAIGTIKLDFNKENLTFTAQERNGFNSYESSYN